MCNKKLIYAAVAVCSVFAFLSETAAQRRDHLTHEEVELVRDVQDVDDRMAVFAKAIQRRLWVLRGIESLNAEENKRLKKDQNKWGDLPEGSKTQLISDIEKILNEAIDKLEDVFDREPENKLIPYALHVIADFSESLIPSLTRLAENNEDIRQLGMLETAAKHCESILEARKGVPLPEKKRKKKKRSR